jgi:hypothetical protein
LAAILLVAVIVCGCVTTSPSSKTSPPAALPGIEITFEQRGAAPNLWEQRLAETGDPTPVPPPGSDYWYRLRNNSQEVISLPTASMYLLPIKEWHELPDGKTKVNTLGEGRRILILFGLEDRKGRPIPYGGDFHSISTLLPGRSVFFSVPQGAFRKGQRVFLSYRAVDPKTWRDLDPLYKTYVSQPESEKSP